MDIVRGGYPEDAVAVGPGVGVGDAVAVGAGVGVGVPPLPPLGGAVT